VTARAINVEKGGMFSGQLAIGEISLAQGELLGKEEPSISRSTESSLQGGVARPLPAA
jgi:hypothetical protein